jgi:hypothetical protein
MHGSRRAFSILLVAGLAAVGCNDATKDVSIYQAGLSGAGEFPPRSSAADGAMGFNVEGSTVHYSIEVHGITGVIGAHIHSGAAGSNGPIAIALYPGPGVNFSSTPTNGVDGILIEGSFTAADVVGVSFDELLSEMRAGTAYANVHTTAFPGGEIRGQVRQLQ